VWNALLIIVVIFAFMEMRKGRLGRRDRDETPALPDDSELRREVTELRERIKVLEQITVEGRETRALADEIEKLRDN
jgi:hypothetical protein